MIDCGTIPIDKLPKVVRGSTGKYRQTQFKTEDCILVVSQSHVELQGINRQRKNGMSKRPEHEVQWKISD
jgi:hypothetical protein